MSDGERELHEPLLGSAPSSMRGLAAASGGGSATGSSGALPGAAAAAAGAPSYYYGGASWSSAAATTTTTGSIGNAMPRSHSPGTAAAIAVSAATGSASGDGLSIKYKWEFAGYGETIRLSTEQLEALPETAPKSGRVEIPPAVAVGSIQDGGGGGDGDGDGGLVHRRQPHKLAQAHHELLGQFRGTSIAGNDITSSVLYTAGLCTARAGKLAPFSLALVCVVLFLFRSIYTESVTALPLNGGAYNILLNTTSKLVASVAACLTMLSYIATAVVSANSAAQYVTALWDGFPLQLEILTIALLVVFALLNMFGLRDSANVAFVIFVGHLAVLTILVLTCVVVVIADGGSMLRENWAVPTEYNFALDIYFGFSTAMLGVTGFESSANYVEEQKPGVFPKTLRNMAVLVALFNPTIGVLALGVLPISQIKREQNFLLTAMAKQASGSWLGYVVSIDAAIVLAGSVLTAYVGIGGLIERMTRDRCLPQLLLAKTPVLKTNVFIIWGFCGVCSLLFIMVGGRLEPLSGVYTVSFLSVMTLFAVGNMLLKYKRARLPRDTSAWWPTVVVGASAVLAGLIGNAIINSSILRYFAIFFAAAVTLVLIMLYQPLLLKLLYYFLLKLPLIGKNARVERFVTTQIKKISNSSVIFFAKEADISVLHKALEYIAANELVNSVKIVHIYQPEDGPATGIEDNVRVLDEIYKKIKVDLVLVSADQFDPWVADRISLAMGVPKNFCFMSTPSDKFPHDLAEFGGCRLIMH